MSKWIKNDCFKQPEGVDPESYVWYTCKNHADPAKVNIARINQLLWCERAGITFFKVLEEKEPQLPLNSIEVWITHNLICMCSDSVDASLLDLSTCEYIGNIKCWRDDYRFVGENDKGWKYCRPLTYYELEIYKNIKGVTC